MIPTNVDKVEVSWDDVLDGNFPSTKNPARHAFRQAVTEVAAKATATLPAAVNGKVAKAVAIVLAGDIEIFQDGRAVVGSQSDSDLKHVVESAGGCTCKDSDRPEIESWCKHKIAVAIMKRATALANDKIAAHVDGQQNAPGDTPRAEPRHHAGETRVSIPPEFITKIHGRDFVQYAGLLALAHKQELVSLSARFIEVTGELALAEATAEFKDGRVFKECSDATPSNVHPKVKAHFPRMALTRAKARALRDALNISMCSVEELEAQLPITTIRAGFQWLCPSLEKGATLMGQAGTNRQLGLFNQDKQIMSTTTASTKKEQCLGIPIYKVSLVREREMCCYNKCIRSSANASALLQRYLVDVDREHFVVMLLDRKNQVIGFHTVSIGSLTASVVHPRETFKVAILANATAIICGHNHPSGDPTPSTEDKALTSRLVESGKLLGIEVLDHVIVGDGSQRYFSFADEGLL